MKEINIQLADLRFHAHHGVLPQETKVGNEFVVDVSLWIPFNSHIYEDDLSSTISYADVYTIVEEEMMKPRKLLETVAATIARRVMKQWQNIIRGDIKICKSTPPIPGITGSSSVALFF